MAKSKKQPNSLKSLIKSVVTEMIEENEELVRRIFEEAIEDAFMSKAINNGRKSRKVSREKIFRTLAESSR